MLFEELPAFVKESSVFNIEEKLLLTRVDNLPCEDEVDKFKLDPHIQELTNAFIGDETTRNVHLQEHAKLFLKEGDIYSAWKIILL